MSRSAAERAALGPVLPVTESLADRGLRAAATPPPRAGPSSSRERVTSRRIGFNRKDIKCMICDFTTRSARAARAHFVCGHAPEHAPPKRIRWKKTPMVPARVDRLYITMLLSTGATLPRGVRVNVVRE